MHYFLFFWLLITGGATLLAATAARRNGHLSGFYLAAGLLIGPGVLGVQWVCSDRKVTTAWERYRSRITHLLVGLVVLPPFALAHSVFIFYAVAGRWFLDFWRSASLALPTPTQAVWSFLELLNAHGEIGIPLLLVGPGLATRALEGCSYRTPWIGALRQSCDRLSRMHSRRQPGSCDARSLRLSLELELLELAPRILFLHGWLLSILFLMVLGLLLPFYQLAGWVGG